MVYSILLLKLSVLLVLLIITFTINDVLAEEMGIIEWTQDSYTLDESPKIRVIDVDLNVNATTFETLIIDVWSNSDATGIDLILNETGTDTGVFEANIILTTNEESHDTILRVRDNGSIEAEYTDSTLPYPYYPHDDIDITAYASVLNTPMPPLISQLQFQFQSDKTNYYLNDIIYLTGTLENFDTSKANQIDLYFYYSGNIPLPLTYTTYPNSDGVFIVTIQTIDELWSDYTGYIKVVGIIEDIEKQIQFHYSNEPNMANEILYDMITDANDTLDTHYTMLTYQDTMVNDHTNTLTIQNKIIEQQNDIISSLQEDVTILINLVEELLSQVPPLPLDAPIIISVIANDPDNMDDIFSVGDTITILFDSETNIPLGDGILTKSEINNLFTFSDNIAQAYSGTWTNSSAFTININSIANSWLILNSTTVTPAQISLILPADNNQENFSHITSPVLSGDWGTP